MAHHLTQYINDNYFHTIVLTCNTTSGFCGSIRPCQGYSKVMFL